MKFSGREIKILEMWEMGAPYLGHALEFLVWEG